MIGLALIGLALSRADARQAAREELSRQQYEDAKPPAVQRAAGQIIDWIADRLDAATTGLGSSALAQVAFVVLLAVLAAAILVRLGPTAAAHRRQPIFDDRLVRTSAQHRAQSEQYAGAGRWAEAVRERLRAVVRELESRAVLDTRPARTAGEVARDAGAAVPVLAGELAAAATTFGEIWYGARSAVPADYDALVTLDQHVARLTVADLPRGGPAARS